MCLSCDAIYHKHQGRERGLLCGDKITNLIYSSDCTASALIALHFPRRKLICYEIIFLSCLRLRFVLFNLMNEKTKIIVVIVYL